MNKSNFSNVGSTVGSAKSSTKTNTSRPKTDQDVFSVSEMGNKNGVEDISGFTKHNLTDYSMEVTLNKDVSYRKNPDRGSKVLGTLKKGKYISKLTASCYDSSSVYYSYYIEGKGWVSDTSSAITAKEVQKTKSYSIKTDDSKNTYVYADSSTSSEVVKVVKKGSSLNASKTIKDSKGNILWYYIPLYKGYVKADNLEKAEAKTSWVTYKSKEQKEEETKVKNSKKKKINKIKNLSDSDMEKELKNVKDLDKWINSEKDKDIRKAKIDRLSRYKESVMLDKYLNSGILSGISAGNEGKVLEDAANALLTSDPMGFFGIPYQFDENTDEKIPGSVYGVTYAKKILSRMPILMVTPGHAQYMSDFKTSAQYAQLAKLIGLSPTDENDANESTLADLIGGTTSGEIVDSGRYFTFEFDDVEYFNYVNPMCQSGAKFLGIDKTPITIETVDDNGKVKKGTNNLINFDWSTAVVNKIKRNIRAEKTISFYVDGYTTSDEDFSNSTTESQLANKINQFSEIGREIQFLLGTPSGHKPHWMEPVDLQRTIDDIQSLGDEYLNNHKMLTDIAKNFATVATGGQLLFPEIWADSEYSKSFSVSIKLRTPDNDVLSWYLNIYVPLCHLVALTMPRQVETEKGNRIPNGYMSPFLIRAYLKGAFNCDCGIVTSLSVSRGKEGSWTINGLPTEVDVNISFKDLYSMIMLSKSSNKVSWFMANTALMDYIACNCGVNINEPDILRQVNMYAELSKNKYLQMPNRMWSKLTENIEHSIMNLYKKVGI